MKTIKTLEHGDVPQIVGLGIIRRMIQCYWRMTRRHVIAYKYYEEYTRQ